ncbi:hypothetical protein [Providencia rustigianii]|uniref:hypothetical protein n=1 Tax=Providencia rustigianii TaxID=158850 RepID=UPI0035EEA294
MAKRLGKRSAVMHYLQFGHLIHGGWQHWFLLLVFLLSLLAAEAEAVVIPKLLTMRLLLVMIPHMQNIIPQ